MSAPEIKSLPGHIHVILKPTLYGGYSACKQRILHLHPVPCHLSASFESRVGHLHILRMHQELCPNQPVGLGTYAYIEQDILPQPLDFTSGNISKDTYNHMLHDPSQLLSYTENRS